MAEPILNASIVEETRHRYLTYALSVITSRALPDVRDGLKPVQRRILYTMYHELGLRLTQAGQVRTHRRRSHGQVPSARRLAVYEALVRLTQNWVMRVPLVYGQGNFGSVDGDPPPHDRYTEAKLTAVADHLLAELRQRTVPMRPTYNDRAESRSSCPPSFPTCSSTAPPASPSAWPRTFRRTTSATSSGPRFISSRIPKPRPPVCSTSVKGPDFPLGGKIVTDRPTLRKIYEEGTGSIRVQGEWKLEISRQEGADHRHLDPLRRQQGQPGSRHRR